MVNCIPGITTRTTTGSTWRKSVLWVEPVSHHHAIAYQALKGVTFNFQKLKKNKSSHLRLLWPLDGSELMCFRPFTKILVISDT